MKKANITKLHRFIGDLEAIQASMLEIRDQEQESYDEKSERWQESDAGQLAALNIEQIENAGEAIGSALECLQEAAPND